MAGGRDSKTLLIDVNALDGRGHLDRRRRQQRVAVHRPFSEAVEVSEEPVKVLLRDWVELVFVTDGTPHREPEPDGGSGLNAVDAVLEPVLICDCPAFAGCYVAPVEACGHQL